MFNPTRLTIARKRRGKTKTRLAEEAQVSTRIISMYERGDSEPSPETLGNLSKALQFPEAFFFRGDLDEPNPEGASFRGLASMTAAQRDRALAAGSLAIEISSWIGERFRLPEADIPSMRGFGPEAAADAIRSHWGLGEKPCPNMVHLLEAHGVKVFSLPRDSRSVHAFSFWNEDEPFVFLTTDTSGERGRFDAAHELGHLLLHRDGRIRGRAAELEADRFASAFLMPRSSILGHAPVVPFLDSLIKLKRVWKVSLMALIHRLQSTGLITEWQYRTLCIQCSERGFRKSEPNGVARERSQVWDKVFEALKNDGRSQASVARDLALRVSDLNALTFGLVVEPSRGGSPDPTNEAGSRGKPELRVV